jgi:hypothetical protein
MRALTCWIKSNPRLRSWSIIISIMIFLNSGSIMVAYAAKPTVTTLPPQNVTSTSAELYASINPKGKLTTWTFLKEPENCPGCVPPDWCPGAGPLQPVDNLLTVHCTVHNLSPSHMYGYLISATNVDGTTWGDWVRFTTPAAPTPKPAATTLPASKVTATTAQLNGLVYHVGIPADWQIRLAPPGQDFTVKCGGSIIPQMWPIGYAPVVCPVTDLTPSTTYRYYVVAANAYGMSTGDIVSFTTLAGVPSTDWAVSTVGLSPQAPVGGDSVTFTMIMVALSSTAPFPQSVNVQCLLDGGICGEGTVAYSGPQGAPHTVSTTTSWTATVGTHSLTWSISVANDPNPANNMLSTTFAVAAQSQTQTSIETQTTPTSQTTIQTQTSATAQVQPTIQTQTVVQTQLVTQTQPGILDQIQQNSLLVIGALGLLVLLLAVVVLRRRPLTQGGSPALGKPPTASTRPANIFCINCGSSLRPGTKSCPKCGETQTTPKH